MAVTMRAMAGTWRGYAALGLWNLLTVFGLAFRLRHVADGRREMIRNLGPGNIAMVFSLVFVATTLALQVLLLMPL